MSERLPELKVYMLGGFHIVYGEQVILLNKNTGTKAMKLLQMLLHAAGNGEGISRAQLWEGLFGREELSNVANNLRVTAHRLKKLLLDEGLPAAEYIQIENGIYKWFCPMELYVDAADFAKTIEAAKEETDQTRKIELLQYACRLYKGELLPGLSGEDWVIVNSMRYKEQYTEALLEICGYLKEQREYEKILELAQTAAEIYPFDEWQAIKIDALMALKQYKEAHRYYEETAKMFFEELGISPSERMLGQLKEMSTKMGRQYQDAGEIRDGLKEKEREEGAFYCTLPSFRDGYRLIRRIIERNGQSVFLMVCSITDGQGKPMENKEKLEVLSEKLFQSIKNGLRRGDSFTKYSPSQFLVLLVGTNRENCDLIFRRIQNRFSEEHKSWQKYLEYYVSSVADLENDNSRICFREDKFYWE